MSDESLERAKWIFEMWHPDIRADDCKWVMLNVERNPYGGIKNREVHVPIAPPVHPWPIQDEDLDKQVPFRKEVVTLHQAGNNLWMGLLPATEWNRAVVFFGYVRE